VLVPQEPVEVPRPRGVKVVTILSFLEGLVLVALGGAVIAQRSDPSVVGGTASSGVAAALGVGLVALGLVAVFVGVELWRGHRWARLAVGGLQVINIGLGVRQTMTESGAGYWNGLFQIAVALTVLTLLFAGRSDAFFEPRATPRKSASL
jgi:hypothetical protein